MTGVELLLAKLLYGSGMRLNEGLRLRVKDVDFDRPAAGAWAYETDARLCRHRSQARPRPSASASGGIRDTHSAWPQKNQSMSLFSAKSVNAAMMGSFSG